MENVFLPLTDIMFDITVCTATEISLESHTHRDNHHNGSTNSIFQLDSYTSTEQAWCQHFSQGSTVPEVLGKARLKIVNL